MQTGSDSERAVPRARRRQDAIALKPTAPAINAPSAPTALVAPPDDPQAFLASTDMFSGVSDAVLHDVGAICEWLHALGGQVLFREGESGDAVYLVVSGRLVVYTTAADGSEQRLREIGRGGNVGELALLTDEPRSANVRAVRDTMLARLSRSRFQELVARHPGAMLPLTRTLARWIREPQGSRSRGVATTTLAFVPLGHDVPIGWLAASVRDALAAQGSALHVDPSFVDRHISAGAAAADERSAQHDRVSAWLDKLEMENHFLIYQAENGSPAWTRRCIREADRIVFVARAHGDRREARRLIAQLLGDAERGGAREELVLLHTGQAAPSGTAAWCTLRPFSGHHHVRTADARDIERLARRLTGRSVGVVLSGGGARGFAHIGVLQALEEAGIPIDRIGGASMGAIIGALYASGLSPAEVVEVNRLWAQENPLWKVTLPLISLVSERAGAHLAEQAFGDRRIEDLWLDYFCVTTNLTRSCLNVHRDGPLARWALASASIPGIAPPVLSDRGELLVDGGLLNNVPADVMASLDEGFRIAVDVCPPEKLPVGDYARASSPWLRLQMLGATIVPFASSPRVPNIFSILYATAMVGSQRLSERFKNEVDLYLKPPVTGCGIFDWHALDRLVELGHRYAAAHIAASDATLKMACAGKALRASSPVQS
jgi:NTE family protein